SAGVSRGQPGSAGVSRGQPGSAGDGRRRGPAPGEAPAQPAPDGLALQVDLAQPVDDDRHLDVVDPDGDPGGEPGPGGQGVLGEGVDDDVVGDPQQVHPVQLQQDEEDQALQADPPPELVGVQHHPGQVGGDLQVVDQDVEQQPAGGEGEVAVPGQPLED